MTSEDYKAPELPTELDSWKVDQLYEGGLKVCITWHRRHSPDHHGGYTVASRTVEPWNYINGFEQTLRAGKRRLKQDAQRDKQDKIDQANVEAAKRAAGI